MLKVSVLVLLALVGGIWAAGHCDSCGNECSAACGTRRFRACCFNYLRRKRSREDVLWLQKAKETMNEEQDPALFFLKSLPESWFTEFQPHFAEDNVGNRLMSYYD